MDVPALRGVDLDVQAGEFLAIVGPSGSGKSTLFHIIGGLTPPTSGAGARGRPGPGRHDRRRPHPPAQAHRRLRVPEVQPAAESHRARQHRRGALHRRRGFQARPAVRGSAGLLGIDDRLDHKPSALSGGEQQRVAIARAIVNRPAILLADEPTGNLDTENSKAVLEILRDLNERLGQTILMITHNPEAAAYGHRTVHMRDGRIVERT